MEGGAELGPGVGLSPASSRCLRTRNPTNPWDSEPQRSSVPHPVILGWGSVLGKEFEGNVASQGAKAYVLDKGSVVVLRLMYLSHGFSPLPSPVGHIP